MSSHKELPAVSSELRRVSAIEQPETTAGQSLITLPEIVSYIQGLQETTTTHQERTVEVVATDTKRIIVAGYEPGEGEAPRAHPTANVLLVLAGRFHMHLGGRGEEWSRSELGPGSLVNLEPYDQHYIQVPEDQTGLSVLMATILPGMETTHPDYNIPVTLQQ